jgi:ABC-type uncharacterized transport system ATPase subunit
MEPAISVAGAAVLAIGSPPRLPRPACPDDINFDAECGSITGLLGRNGAGKTTLLRKHPAWCSGKAGRKR